MTNANPSLNPTDNDSLVGTFRLVMNKYTQGMDGVLPAEIVAFDRGKNLAQVQPLIDVVATNGQTQKRAQVARVPVYQIGGGGYTLNFNLVPGDQGLLIACDRDISLYVQSGKRSAPNTMRKKNFSDAFFLPMVIRGYSINGEDSTNVVLQNLDNSVRISLWGDKIKMTAPTVEIDGDLVVTGDATLQNNLVVQNDLLVENDSQINGEELVLGDIASAGNITASGTITPGTPP